MKEKLEKFIIDNGLSFTVGQRNANITILSGYALHIGATMEDCKVAIPLKEYSAEVYQEIERVYGYAERNNYAKFWKKRSTKALYKY